MRLVFKLTVAEKLIKMIHDAYGMKKEIEKIILTKKEFDELKQYYLTTDNYD